jgi:hypothetical protein
LEEDWEGEEWVKDTVSLTCRFIEGDVTESELLYSPSCSSCCACVFANTEKVEPSDGAEVMDGLLFGVVVKTCLVEVFDGCVR